MLIQLVACFNFTNLATARATMRAREISLRKVMGATRRQLVIQFLGESVLMALLALVLALAVVEVLLPSFDQFLGGRSASTMLADWPVLAGAVAHRPGFRPVWAASIRPWCCPAFGPPRSCAPTRPGRAARACLRTVLVVLQFAVSIGLGIAALVVFAQISFARNMDLGFRKDNIVIIGAGSMSPQTRDSLRARLAQPAGHSGGHRVQLCAVRTAMTATRMCMCRARTSNPVMRIVPIDPDFPAALWREAAGRAAAGQDPWFGRDISAIHADL